MGPILTLLRSTLGKKLLMAVTGVVLFGFVVGHMLGNLQIWLGPEVLNHYAEALHANAPLLWGTRIVVGTSILVHTRAAIELIARNRKARPVGYRKVTPTAATYAARTMKWTGPIILLFLLYHLAHFTLGGVHHDFIEEDVFHNVTSAFQIPWVVGIYVAAMLALGTHLKHGLFSMLQTVGLNHPRYNDLRELLAIGGATLIVLGNCSIPLGVFGGLIGGQ